MWQVRQATNRSAGRNPAWDGLFDDRPSPKMLGQWSGVGALCVCVCLVLCSTSLHVSVVCACGECAVVVQTAATISRVTNGGRMQGASSVNPGLDVED
jgi:hypothetical protein